MSDELRELVSALAINVMTFVDIVVVPDIDLHWLRSSIDLVATALLVIGLVWEAP
jgi:hypothetical protein